MTEERKERGEIKERNKTHNMAFTTGGKFAIVGGAVGLTGGVVYALTRRNRRRGSGGEEGGVGLEARGNPGIARDVPCSTASRPTPLDSASWYLLRD